MEEKPNYYAIIPADVRYDRDLKDKAKLLYGEITALSNKNKCCYASNKYFADLYGVSIRTITDLIKDLIDKGYVKAEIIYKEGTKEVLQRKLYLWKKTSIPLEENFQDNNTSINNINKKEIYKEKRFIKPTLEEVKAYCQERGNNVEAEHFIDHYESNGWKVGKNPMKDWKATVRNWERSKIGGHKETRYERERRLLEEMCKDE